MNNHNDEKYALEEAAVSIYMNLYNLNHKDKLEIAERRECPDFVLKNEKGDFMGLEVAHLFYNSEEAKMILGRSTNEIHGLENSKDYIETLNGLLKQKEKKILKYETIYPITLLIRNASPIFGMSCFLREKNLIYKPSKYTNVWFVSKDGNYNDWLMKDLLTV
ncbi:MULTISPECIES: hypothetical protein [Paenibacillus]|uniref:Uncharacterized protein n=2 Tax=Paenibacillus lactis TaxID=228574 RepID=G4H9E6_9BACL|nr:hypothetical protein [Paenibacillus lactis]EHB68481.1 hypothetical protein PaelaDRAFT_0607 [Paenibacillus lactis 154]MBP1893491.1 hypothetical protein [Paenibacillus lactis]